MLHSLEFEKFKSWSAPHRLKFGRITGLFGPNSSGKSSIIHLLLLLKQTVESSDSKLVLNFGGGANDYVDFGGFLNIVTDHDISNVIRCSINWSEDVKRKGPYSLIEPERITFTSSVKAVAKRRAEEVVVDSLAYDIHLASRLFGDQHKAELPVSMSARVARGSSDAYTLEAFIDGDQALAYRPLRAFVPHGLHRFSSRALFQIAKGARLHHHSKHKGSSKKAGFLEHYLSDALWADEVIKQTSDYTTQFLQRIVYLGPLRDYPHRNYAWTGATPATVGHRGEEAIQVLLADASQRSPRGQTERSPRTVRGSATVDVVTYWLQRLGIANSLSFEQVGRGARIWEALIEQQPGTTKANLADVGFGVSQVLPVIVALLSAQPGSLVILEHPEIHLHPRIQSELADLLIDVASAGEIQILVESHSEHLLARIQRRIAEGNRNGSGLTPEDVRLYFCELEQGTSKLTPLEIQPSGVITNWPPDFFGDMLAERMALSGYYPASEAPIEDR